MIRQQRAVLVLGLVVQLVLSFPTNGELPPINPLNGDLGGLPCLSVPRCPRRLAVDFRS